MIHSITYIVQMVKNKATCLYLFTSDKATNPSNREEDWEYIMHFCDQVNKELEGSIVAVRLIAHKIQSPQEKEALYGLTVSSLTDFFQSSSLAHRAFLCRALI